MSAAKDRRCRGTNASGKPCGSPIVREDGYCDAHGPGASERMANRGHKGAAVAARRYRRHGLSAEDLPALDSPQAAEVWLEAIGRAVTTGTLGHNEARSAVSAVREWLKAFEAGRVSDRVAELREQVDRLKAGKLRAVQ